MFPEVLLWNQLKQAIEIDGKVHRFKIRKDEARDLHLASEGVHIVRIKAREVFADSYAVAKWIKEICEKLEQGVFDPNEDI